MTTVVDHIDGITLEGNVFENPANEYWALTYLHAGLEFLYQQARKCDEAIKDASRLPADLPPEVAKSFQNGQGQLSYYGIGNLPGIPRSVSTKLLTCAFHWYAVSACQYVRTVGAIACRLDNNRRSAKDYVEAVIPAVLAFRDKVAAHFAWTTKNRNDNDAERLASILPSLGIQDNSFHVMGFKVISGKDGKETTSEELTPWSICKVHEQLRKRYWPMQNAGEP